MGGKVWRKKKHVPFWILSEDEMVPALKIWERLSEAAGILVEFNNNLTKSNQIKTTLTSIIHLCATGVEDNFHFQCRLICRLDSLFILSGNGENCRSVFPAAQHDVLIWVYCQMFTFKKLKSENPYMFFFSKKSLKPINRWAKIFDNGFVWFTINGENQFCKCLNAVPPKLEPTDKSWPPSLI